jgi:hypothetical protein
MLEHLIVASLATAFMVGVIDGLHITWWPRARPFGGLVFASFFCADWIHPLGQFERLTLVVGAAFAGLALPSLLDSAVTRTIAVPMRRSRL